MVTTYGKPQKYSWMAEYNMEGGAITHGGYSESIVVNKDYVLHIPASLDLAATAPLLCAGITTYSPLKHFGLKPNHRLAVLGLGGLGEALCGLLCVCVYVCIRVYMCVYVYLYMCICVYVYLCGYVF